MNMFRLSATLVASLGLSLALAGCGTTEEGEEGAGGPKPDSTEALVSAATGGAVALADGAGVTIPAGALAADTTISIASTEPSGLPDAAALRGLLYDFGPDGTTFLLPVALTLPMPGTPAAGETAVLSWLDEAAGSWVDLPTTVAGGNVTAPVEHFTRFIVRFRPGALPGECTFTSCGGDPTGSWTLDSACFDFDQNPFAANCPDATFEIDVSGATGTLELGADATYTVDFHLTGSLSYTLPAACLGGAPACADMNNAEDGTTCAAAASGDGCTCTKPITDNEDPAETGTYTMSGTTMTMTDSAPESTPTTLEFCVEGSVLKVMVAKDGQSQIVTLTR